MIRIKMPLTFRIQNFLMLEDGLFWTSASLTIWQKIKRWYNKETGHVCNTSKGFTLPHHGQYVRYDDNIVCMEKDADYVYSATSGRFLYTRESTLPNLSAIRALKPGIALQGIAFDGETPKYAVFGWPDRLNIDVFDIQTKLLVKSLPYKSCKKWYWFNWEAEGIQIINNKVEIGISIKTIFGFKFNYRKEI
jgi:hypothetical protein